MNANVAISIISGMYFSPNQVTYDAGACVISYRNNVDSSKAIHGSVQSVRKLEPFNQWIVVWEGVALNGNPVTIKVKTLDQSWKSCTKDIR